MPLLVHYPLCLCTPVQHEPIKAQTSNLGVSPLLNYSTNEQLPHKHETTERRRARGGGGSVLLHVMISATGLYALKKMRYFPIVPKRFRAPICLQFFFFFLLQCFEDLGLKREVTRHAGGGDEGGVRRVKSHLEARDGAEFHAQHLEFQLHHVSQTHSRIRQWGRGGMGWVFKDVFH